MKVAVIGAGYVGLVSAACFADIGCEVVCAEEDRAKFAKLNGGTIPIFEPGLELLVTRNMSEGRLRFVQSVGEAIGGVDACLIAVGTPSSADGSADLAQVFAAAVEIGRHLKDYLVVVVKSTVPVGTAEKVNSIIQAELGRRNLKIACDVVSNPEFLKEGAAVKDFMSPERIIVGTDSDRARKCMRELYAHFMRNHDRFVFMGVREAEMTKYAANAMLATRISFMNEIAYLCDRLGVDVESVRVGIGSDHRIGYHFIYPGCGYGGSCFPKDIRALIRMARDAKMDPIVLRAVEERNEFQKHVLFEKITARFGRDLSGLVFGVWGLAFKPETDDIREASSMVLLGQLVEAGARVKAYDPVAMDAARRELPRAWLEQGQVELTQRQYDVIEHADALVLITEWRSFRNLDVDRLTRSMKRRIIFDGRNLYDRSQLKDHGFEYFGIGR